MIGLGAIDAVETYLDAIQGSTYPARMRTVLAGLVCVLAIACAEQTNQEGLPTNIPEIKFKEALKEAEAGKTRLKR